MGSLANEILPTIILSEKNLQDGSPSWLSTSKDVVVALENYGCFIAIYSRFPMDLHEAIFEASEELFDLPTDVKMQNISDTPSHGYVGQEPYIPLYEALGIENATTDEGVNRFTSLFWPSGHNRFCETALEFSKNVAELDLVVMKMVSGYYGIETSYEPLLEKTSYLVRLIKYRVPMKDETSIGIIPHTDKSFMSILHQRQVKGLQVQTKTGHWIDVDPSPSSFLVMVGDACMAWTNGRLHSPYHRVMMTGEEARYSIGLFSIPKPGYIIKAPDEMVDEQHPLLFKPFDHHKYLDFYHTEEGRASPAALKAYCGAS